MTDDYALWTGRNEGFVTPAEQRRLREARVLVAGVGGMGGAAFQCLVRAGVGAFDLAEIDRFERSNLNRQVFATRATLGRPKHEAAAEAARAVNPAVALALHGAGWVEALDDLLPRADVVVNGTDDVGATTRLYRAARRHGRTVVDAYAAPLPSVYVTAAGDPVPEDRFGAPTRGRPPEEWTEADLRDAFARELAFVLAHSSARRHLDMGVAREVGAGTRPRPSFAPMVLMAGTLMAAEAIGAILGRPSGAGWRGYFLDTARGRVERPGRGPLAALRERAARVAVRRMVGR